MRDARSQVVNVIDPAALQAQLLDTALVNQETGVRGYALSAQQSFLAPYTDGLTAEQAAISSLTQLAGQLPAGTSADIHSVASQAQYWRTRYAEPTISQVNRTDKPVVEPGHHHRQGGLRRAARQGGGARGRYSRRPAAAPWPP